MKDDKLYLIHIMECIERIENYSIAGKNGFMESTLVQDAIIRNLQTLAESTQRLSENLKLSHPQVDWRAISGFRNVLAHNYLGVDVHYVWQVIEQDLPPLKQHIETMLKN